MARWLLVARKCKLTLPYLQVYHSLLLSVFAFQTRRREFVLVNSSPATDKLCVEAILTSPATVFLRQRCTLYQLLEGSIDWGTWLDALVELDCQLGPFCDTFRSKLEFLRESLAISVRLNCQHMLPCRHPCRHRRHRIDSSQIARDCISPIRVWTSPQQTL